jgi:hypothetical protein
MVTIDRSRVWPVLLLLTAIMLVHPPSARAARIDINDPSVLQSMDLGDVDFLRGLITEVAIYTSSSVWGGFGSPTNTVVSMTPLYDGYLVVPELVNQAGSVTVVYMQSALPPSRDGILTYTGRVKDQGQDPPVVITDSEQWDGMLVPIAEPGSIVLFGLGLASLAAKRRASRPRRVARPAKRYPR